MLVILPVASSDTGKIISSVQQIVLPLPCKADGQKYVYNRDSLPGIRDRCRNGPLGDLNRLSEHGLLCRYRGNQGTSSPGATTVSKQHCMHCNRIWKQGKRGGVSARWTANPCKPAVPSVLLANVRSLDAKMDNISLWRTLQQELRDCCVFMSMKTWLTEKIPDSRIDLAGLTLHRRRSGYLHKQFMVLGCSNNLQILLTRCGVSDCEMQTFLPTLWIDCSHHHCSVCPPECLISISMLNVPQDGATHWIIFTLM